MNHEAFNTGKADRRARQQSEGVNPTIRQKREKGDTRAYKAHTIHETSVGEVHEVIIKALKEQEKGE